MNTDLKEFKARVKERLLLKRRKLESVPAGLGRTFASDLEEHKKVIAHREKLHAELCGKSGGYI